MKTIVKVLLVSVLVFTSCNVKKEVAGGVLLPKISKKQLIENHYSNFFSQKTVSAKIAARYSNVKTSVGFVIKMRMENNNVIWLSASKMGFPVAKIKITPTKVRYYEKVKRTYFEGDFKLLSTWLGTNLDFNQVQNLLLGQALQNLDKSEFTLGIKDKSYVLASKKTAAVLELLFLLNPSTFKINKQEIKNRKDQQFLQISYPKYSKIGNEVFPKQIEIKVLEKQKLTTIKLEYKQVEFNKTLNFPFTIPKGYKKVVL